MHFNFPSNFICFTIQERSVDFPLPFAPTAAKISPSLTSTDRFERTSFPFSYPAYKCEIEIIAENEIETKIIEEQKNIQEKIKVDIYQGLPKSDKMELIIQKSVELGANSIIPVNMKRCVVKLEGKDEIKKNERWQKIAESAAKQCGRGFIPEVKHLINVKEICNWINEYDVIIVAYENEKENTLKAELKKLKATDLKIGIVIGPEGGFEESDIKLLKESGAKIVTLGDRILRTETVALNVLSIIMYEFEQ